MADEVNASFTLPGQPSSNIASWRADPPAFLVDGRFERTDESYESLVYEANVTTKFVKITTWGFGKTLYTLSFTFRPQDDATHVTVIGQATEETRAAIARYVATSAST